MSSLRGFLPASSFLPSLEEGRPMPSEILPEAYPDVLLDRTARRRHVPGGLLEIIRRGHGPFPGVRSGMPDPGSNAADL